MWRFFLNRTNKWKEKKNKKEKKICLRHEWIALVVFDFECVAAIVWLFKILFSSWCCWDYNSNAHIRILYLCSILFFSLLFLFGDTFDYILLTWSKTNMKLNKRRRETEKKRCIFRHWRIALFLLLHFILYEEEYRTQFN